MARRKQRKPKHFENSDDLAHSLQNGIRSGSDTEDDEHVCGKCRAEFPSLAEFLQHKKRCVSKRPVLLVPLDELEDDSDDELGDIDESDDRLTPPLLEKVRKPREWGIWGKNLSDIHPLLLLAQHRRPDTNVTLEELKNTTVAVAQHGQLLSNHLALREFFSRFHQRHVESLQLIKTIEDIVLKTDGMPAPTVAPPPLIGTAALTPPQSADGGPAVASASVMAAYPQGGRTGSLSPIPPPPPETNNLALLEKQAERYLQDSMSRRSFMLNGIDEDSRVKKSKSDPLDPAHRNRCHFCGKTLGSESALQIHLRSHTGEKPFRCNVCGSSFSTKGNLKVHCQRHRELGGSIDEQRQMELSDSRTENPPLLFAQDSGTRGETKSEQALDFSSAVNGRRSPVLDSNSRSMSPNDMSNFSDNSDESSDENMTAENFRELKIDVERFDDEDQADSDGMDDDESEMATSQPSFGPSPNFAPYFLPSSCENFVPSASQSENKNSANGSVNNGGSEAILQDPSFYQDLLPRIGSNDNSWESLIEVTKTSETSKLQQLVDNIEHKLIEPNQCIICHRVLSCKSALQMHYRTHTGERPFKCKLCSRAFTTKGNLKTHMGVHRTKPATRLMHQCPVCHKPFPNSLLLQQHVRNHTENPSIQLPPLYGSNEDRPPTLLPPSYPRQFLLPPPQLMNAEPLALTSSKTNEQLRNNSTNQSVIKATGLDNNNGSQVSCASPTLSTASSCSPSSNIAESPKDPKPPVLDLARSPEEQSPKDADELAAAENTTATDNELEKSRNSNNSTPVDMKPEYETNIKSVLNHNQSPSNISDHSPLNGQEAEEQRPPSARSPPKFSSQPNNSIVISLASDRPLPMTLPNDCPLPFSIHGSDRPYPAMTVSTCTSDYTASLAALENHVKGITSNVTQPLPFPPHFGLGLNVSGYYRDFGYPPKPSNISPTASKNGSDVSADDRSTPGGVGTGSKGESPRLSSLPNHSTPKSESNIVSGALDLTPRNSPAFQRPSPSDTKIYALPLAGLPFAPPHSRIGTTCRICFKTFACQSALEIHYRSHTKERPFRCEVCDRGFSTKGNMRQHMLTHKIRDLPSQVFSTSNTNSSSSSVSSSQKVETNGERSPKKSPEESAPIKRPPAESPVPVPQPKRAPGQPKHMCEVCHKPFSSGSALQIHMRTHTGDKPFQCHICQRAFTTKGNLKVHMGTHMWNNSTSRRGRRMSLDLGPLQIPPGAKPGEFPQAPFFPYLSPFMNGLPPPPPKMNEISVIQTAGISNGPSPTTATTSSPSAAPQQPLALLSAACKQREESSLNQNQILSQGKDSRPAMTPPAPEMNVSWPWKISCNICSKICTSSTELEMHIRNNHCKKESSETPGAATRADPVA